MFSIVSVHPLNIIKALSTALELSSGGLSRHQWRTAVIANRLAEHLALEESRQQLLIYASLIHDIGAAADWEEKRRLKQLDSAWDIFRHAEDGYFLLKDSSQMGELAEIIRYHHDRFSGGNPSGLAGKDIPLLSRIIHLADRVEVLFRDDVYAFDQRPDILSAIRGLSGNYFDPDLVKALHEFARQDSFWLDLANPHYYGSFFRMVEGYGRVRLTIDDIIDIGEIFAGIIDRTSVFTAAHSRSVSLTSMYLAQARGYGADEVKLMQVAGLFHDLGKLAIPKQVLEKPGKLTGTEFSIIKQHPYYTYRILEQIDGFSLIAAWAAYHHETMDGAGYPFRIPPEKLLLGSRIVAVADVFTALVEPRPYRKALGCEEAEKIMREMVANRKLDGDVVKDIFWDCRNLYDRVLQETCSRQQTPTGALA